MCTNIDSMCTHVKQNSTMQTISDRFIELIDLAIQNKTKFKTLENLSGIPAVSWRKAYLRGQRPTVEMIEAVVQFWPEFAFWLATGITDSDHGHRKPGSEMIDVWIVEQDGQVRIKENFAKRERTAAHDYFFKCIQLAKLPKNENAQNFSVQKNNERLANVFATVKESDRLKKIRIEQEATLSKIESEDIAAIVKITNVNEYVAIAESEWSAHEKRRGEESEQ